MRLVSTVCLGSLCAFFLSACVGTPHGGAGRGRAPVPLPRPGTVKSPEDVISTLRALERSFTARHDARGVFVTIYVVSSEALYKRLGTGFFEDDAYVARVMVVFAGLYLEALGAYERGDRRRVPPAWRLAHDATRENRVRKHELAILAVNAHIRDLAVAVYRVEREHGLPNSRHDYVAVNDVLRDATGRAQHRLATIYAAGMHALDVLGLDLDERFAHAFLVRRRAASWQFGQRLLRADSAAERAAIVAELDADAVREARRLRRLPMFLRWIEGENAVWRVPASPAL